MALKENVTFKLTPINFNDPLQDQIRVVHQDMAGMFRRLNDLAVKVEAMNETLDKVNNFYKNFNEFFWTLTGYIR